MATTNKAKITQWNEDKGFGFATANGVKYFVHISALGRPSRPPRVGDTVIIASFEKTAKGPRIERGELEGVPDRAELYAAQSVHKVRPHRNFSIVGLIIILSIASSVISTLYAVIEDPSPNSNVATAQSPASSQYTSRDEVAKFICENGYLPPNYVSKSEGKRLYEAKTGNTFRKWNFNPLTTLGVMIGGDYFQNREGRLPPGDYREADVDYFAENRGTKRLVYTSGCNIYYTSDHYGSFTKLSF